VEGARQDVVERWNQLTAYDSWHPVPCVAQRFGDVHLASLSCWKEEMLAPVEVAPALLSVFGIEPECSICNSQDTRAGFAGHCVAKMHYQKIYQCCEDAGSGDVFCARDAWQAWLLPFARLRYNHYSGEVQMMRHQIPPLPLTADFSALGDQWADINYPACVAMKTDPQKNDWPNMWGKRLFKEVFMARPVNLLMKEIRRCGGNPDS
ncbi:unnamed protein product, partial [Polarella glacialis]